MSYLTTSNAYGYSTEVVEQSAYRSYPECLSLDPGRTGVAKTQMLPHGFGAC